MSSAPQPLFDDLRQRQQILEIEAPLKDWPHSPLQSHISPIEEPSPLFPAEPDIFPSKDPGVKFPTFPDLDSITTPLETPGERHPLQRDRQKSLQVPQFDAPVAPQNLVGGSEIIPRPFTPELPNTGKGPTDDVHPNSLVPLRSLSQSLENELKSVLPSSPHASAARSRIGTMNSYMRELQTGILRSASAGHAENTHADAMSKAARHAAATHQDGSPSSDLNDVGRKISDVADKLTAWMDKNKPIGVLNE